MGGLPALLSLFMLLWPSLAAHSAGRQQIKGHMTASDFSAPLVGELTGSEKMLLAIGLPPRDPAGANDLFKQLYDSHSPQFGHYLKKGEFAHKFGPTDSDYQAVMDFVRSNGLEVVHGHSGRTVLFVSGTSAAVQKAFHVHLHYYRRNDGTSFFAPEEQPSVDLDVPLMHVGGLNNFVLPHRDVHAVPLGKASALRRGKSGSGKTAKGGADSVLGSGAQGNFMGSDFRNAYAPNVSLTGAGQTIALYESEGYNQSDINEYEALSGLPTVPISTVLVDGVDGTAGYSSAFQPPPFNNNVEVSMDIELAIAMAPGLAQINVYEGNPSILAINSVSVFPDDILATIADDDSAQIVSCSYSFYAETTTSAILLQMALQGQSFFVSSGDTGAYGNLVVNGNVICNGTCNAIQDEDLATSVGGTLLTMNGNGASYASETGWSGSGGGFSSDMSIPPYQSGFVTTANGASSSMKNFPDVSMPAQNIYAVATSFTSGGNPVTGIAFSSGGTSAATPLWAAFVALVNQQRAQNSLGPLGLANAALYAAASANYGADFHDITSGTNPDTQGLAFQAVPGYDLVTGLGSPTGQSLINDLCPSCVPAAAGPTGQNPVFSTPVPNPNSPCLTLEGTITGISSGGKSNFGPQGLALDASGNLYVADLNTLGVDKFGPAGGLLPGLFSNGNGTGPGQFMNPLAVAVDNSGNVFVSDLLNKRVTKFDPNGNLLTFVGTAMSFLDGIAVDSSGNVYVANFGDSQLLKFDNNGDLLGTIGSGVISDPTAMTLDASNNLYVMDPANSRIEKFGPDGSLVTQWGSAGSGPGQFASLQGGSFNQLCVAGPGLLFAVDSGNNRVQIFNPTGTFLGQITGYGFRRLYGAAGNASCFYVSDQRDGGDGVIDIFDVGNCPAGAMTPPATPVGPAAPTAVSTPTPTATMANTPSLPCVPNGASWNPGTTSGFPARSDFGSVVYNNEMWAVGGEMQSPAGPVFGNVVSNDVWLSTDGTTWQRLIQDGGFPPRMKADMAVFDPGDGQGPRMYLIGGLNPFTNPPNTIYNDIYASFDGANWNLVTSNAPFLARVSPALAVFRNRLWIIGGGGFDDVWSSADGIHWVQNVQHVAGFNVSSGNSVDDAAVLNGELWVVTQSNMGALSNQLWHTQDGYTWVAGGALSPPNSFDNFAFVPFAGELWMIGGSNGTERSDLVWTDSAPLQGQAGWDITVPTGNYPFAPRALHNGGLVFQNQIWLLGGALGPATPGGATAFGTDTWVTACAGVGGIPHGIKPNVLFNEIVTLQVPSGGAANVSLSVSLSPFTSLVSSNLAPSSANGSQLVFNYPSLPVGTFQIVLTLAVSAAAPGGASVVPQAIVSSTSGTVSAQFSPAQLVVAGPTPTATPTQTVTPSPTKTPTATFTPTATPTPCLPSLASPNLDLKVKRIQCGSNLVAYRVYVQDADPSTPVKLSDLTVKLWAFDTGITQWQMDNYYSGLLFGSGLNGAQVNGGFTMKALPFTPACAADPNHKANWEFDVTSTSSQTIPANGGYWIAGDFGIHPANFTPNFNPGLSSWFSQAPGGVCADTGSSNDPSTYYDDPHYALYYQGNLVAEKGGTDPNTGTVPCTLICPPSAPGKSKSLAAFAESLFSGSAATATPSPTSLVQRTESVVAAPNVSRNGEPVRFVVNLDQASGIKLALFTLTGEQVYSASSQGVSGGNNLVWPLRNNAGESVASGLYVYILETSGTDGVQLHKGKIVVIH